MSSRQFLAIITDFVSEKSQCERRVSDLSKSLLELQSGHDAAISELDVAKQAREEAESQLKGSQLQLTMTDATILTLEERISKLQHVIASHRLNLDELKQVEAAIRDEFTEQMFAYNREIREWLKNSTNAAEIQCYPLSPDDGQEAIHAIKGFQESIRKIDDEICKAEIEIRMEQDNHNKILEELEDAEKRCFLVEAIREETRKLEELGLQASEMEKIRSFLAAELQRRYVCPSCEVNNMTGMGRVLQITSQ